MCTTLNIQVDTHNFVHISVSEFSCNAKTRFFFITNTYVYNYIYCGSEIQIVCRIAAVLLTIASIYFL